MIVRLACGALQGVDAFRVDLEVDFLRKGMPAFVMVGLAEGAVREAKERVFAAMRSCGFTLPAARITVNLAPADRRKAGSAYDLPLAVALLGAAGILPAERLEGWFLAGEMAELITSGTPNIVCIQPFACLPNHVVGKGVIKSLRAAYPGANIVAVDYDPGASEVNQLNRIKLMLTAAQRALHAQEATPKKPQPPEAPSISLPHPKVAML